MMNNIINFNFKNQEVRTVNQDGNIWFVAKDVANVLGYSNYRDAISTHVDSEDVAKHDTLTNGGTQLTSYINESGLYALILGSKLPQAKEFKKWVTSEVLPSIRRTGSYASFGGVTLPKTMEEAVQIIFNQAVAINVMKAKTTKKRIDIEIQDDAVGDVKRMILGLVRVGRGVFLSDLTKKLQMVERGVREIAMKELVDSRVIARVKKYRNGSRKPSTYLKRV